MFDFAVRGSVVGFNPTKDGTKSFVKIQPTGNWPGLNRDERPGLLDVQVPVSATKGLSMNSQVLVRGKAGVVLKDWRDPREGTQKTFTNYRFEADSIEAVKA